MTPTRWAATALITYAPHGYVQRRLAQPVEFADTATGRCDLRAALNIARGVPMDRIGPADGIAEAAR